MGGAGTVEQGQGSVRVCISSPAALQDTRRRWAPGTPTPGGGWERGREMVGPLCSPGSQGPHSPLYCWDLPLCICSCGLPAPSSSFAVPATFLIQDPAWQPLCGDSCLNLIPSPGCPSSTMVELMLTGSISLPSSSGPTTWASLLKVGSSSRTTTSREQHLLYLCFQSLTQMVNVK